MSFAAPAWLVGLLLAPAIWYLHRSGPILRRYPVASLLLWKEAVATAAEAGLRRRADPAWIWRAGIAALLSLAMSQPQLDEGAAPVTIWLDDSPSMQTAERGRTRLATGLQQASDEASARSAHDVVVRRLSRPWQALSVPAAMAVRDAAEPATTPPDELLDPRRSHWLVSDGTHASVNRWLRGAPIERVIQPVSIDRNVGITHLAARREPGARERIAVEVRVANGGSAREQRRLTLDLGGPAATSRELQLEAGSSQVLSFEVDTVPPSLRAALAPVDALLLDDAAELDPSALEPVDVAIAGSCPDAIARAVAAHPGLRREPDHAAQLRLVCGHETAALRATPTIRVAAGPAVTVDPGQLVWRTGLAGTDPIDMTQLPGLGRTLLEAPTANDSVLLSAGDTPLIIQRAGTPTLIDVGVDIESSSSVTEQTFPLLIAWLVDEALGRHLLGEVASLDRGTDSSRVVPLETLQVPKSEGSAAHSRVPMDLTPLILLALVALAWDGLVLLRRLRRDVGRGIPAT